MKYETKTIKERIDLIVREEINRKDYHDIDTFINKLITRILELVQDEIKYRRYE